MKKSALFLLLACVATAKCADPDSANEMEYREGTRVDPKYSLPQVNLSAGGNHTVVPASLARVLNFYNTEVLAANWERTKGFVGAGCRRDVEMYLQGKRKMENWALKSELGEWDY